MKVTEQVPPKEISVELVKQTSFYQAPSVRATNLLRLDMGDEETKSAQSTPTDTTAATQSDDISEAELVAVNTLRLGF